MLDTNDPSILWISPSAKSEGDGTHENPFDDIEKTFAVLRPGRTMVLMAGVYDRDTTFDISGTIHHPIRIMADAGADVEIMAACWFFYDVSDAIISGLTFRDAPFGAVSAVGACCRNRFDSLRFVNCGTRDAAACTFFFGGSGGCCNVVENCRFERPLPRRTTAHDSDRKSIGLMVSEGDSEGGHRSSIMSSGKIILSTMITAFFSAPVMPRPASTATLSSIIPLSSAVREEFLSNAAIRPCAATAWRGA